MQIRVEPDQLQELSTGLQTQKEAFNDTVAQMQNLVNQIPDAWAGAAAEAYQTQFNDLKPTFDSVSELIDTISVQITQVIEEVQALDSAIAGKLG